MQLLRIQPNYTNRFSFKNNETKPETSNPSEPQKEGMSKNTKIAAGVVTAAVALAGLGYLGYKGKLGSKIQKFLGGAENATKNIGKNSDVSPKAPEGVKTPAAEPHVPKSPEIKSETPEVIKPNGNLADAEIEETYKFLTKEELYKMDRSKAFEQIGMDIQQIEADASSKEEAFININQYINRYADLDFDLDDKATVNFLENFGDRMLTTYGEVYKKFPIERNHIQFATAELKLMKNDINAAEKYLVEIINDDLTDEAKVDAVKVLNSIYADSNPEKVAAIFDKAVEKDILGFAEQQKSFNVLVENFTAKNGNLTPEEDEVLKAALDKYIDKKSYFNNIIYDLTDEFDKSNKTINAVKELTGKIDEFWDSISAITSRYEKK